MHEDAILVQRGCIRSEVQTFIKSPQAHLVCVNQSLPQNVFMFLDGNSLKCHRKSLECIQTTILNSIISFRQLENWKDF